MPRNQRDEPVFYPYITTEDSGSARFNCTDLACLHPPVWPCSGWATCDHGCPFHPPFRGYPCVSGSGSWTVSSCVSDSRSWAGAHLATSLCSCSCCGYPIQNACTGLCSHPPLASPCSPRPFCLDLCTSSGSDSPCQVCCLCRGRVLPCPFRPAFRPLPPLQI